MVCVRVRACACVCAYICVYVCAYVHASVRVCACMCVHTVLGISVSLVPANKQKLGISSYGLSVTTMEEVFMKVGEESGEFENFL